MNKSTVARRRYKIKLPGTKLITYSAIAMLVSAVTGAITMYVAAITADVEHLWLGNVKILEVEMRASFLDSLEKAAGNLALTYQLGLVLCIVLFALAVTSLACAFDAERSVFIIVGAALVIVMALVFNAANIWALKQLNNVLNMVNPNSSGLGTFNFNNIFSVFFMMLCPLGTLIGAFMNKHKAASMAKAYKAGWNSTIKQEILPSAGPDGQDVKTQEVYTYSSSEPKS